MSNKVLIGLLVAGGLGFAAFALYRLYKTQQFTEWTTKQAPKQVVINVPLPGKQAKVK